MLKETVFKIIGISLLIFVCQSQASNCEQLFQGKSSGWVRIANGWVWIAPQEKIKLKASASLGKNLNDDQIKAVERAHLVGLGQKGKDDTPAQIDNYTKPQLREKVRILKEAGFSETERRKLIEDGVAGWKFWKRTPQLKPATDILEELNEESTQVHSAFTVYEWQFRNIGTAREYFLEYSYELGENVYDNFAKLYLNQIDDSYYWTGYAPKKKNQERNTLQMKANLL